MIVLPALLGLLPVMANANESLFAVLQTGSRLSPGLGGDPFRSPIDDRDGWWRNTQLAGRAGVLAWSEVANPLIGGAAFASQHEARTRLLVHPDLPGGTWSLAVRYSERTRSIGWSGSSGTLETDLSAPVLELGIRSPALWDALTFQAIGPTSSGPTHHSRRSGFGWRLDLGPRATVQMHWNDVRDGDVFRSTLYDEPISTAVNLRTRGKKLDVRAQLAPRLLAEGSMAYWTHDPSGDRTRGLVYQIEPQGESVLDEVGLAWGAESQFRSLVRWTRRGSSLQADVRWGGERFGQLYRAEVVFEAYLVALELPLASSGRCLIDASRVHARADAAGRLESWPFVGEVEQLLGVSRYFRATGRAEWWRAHLGYQHTTSSGNGARIGVNWYSIAPQASLESWRPLFLAFGRTDEQVDILDVSAAHLASVSLGATLHWGRASVQAGIDQFVHARARYEQVDDPAPTPGDPRKAEPRSASGDNHSWPSGTHAEVQINWRF